MRSYEIKFCLGKVYSGDILKESFSKINLKEALNELYLNHWGQAIFIIEINETYIA